MTNISIKSLNSLCGLFKRSVEAKATANAGNKLILFWIDKTRMKKWVIHVQERVLNLLFTMLVNKSSESEDDTVKVRDFDACCGAQGASIAPRQRCGIFVHAGREREKRIPELDLVAPTHGLPPPFTKGAGVLQESVREHPRPRVFRHGHVRVQLQQQLD
jgi:hypothetical protein